MTQTPPIAVLFDMDGVLLDSMINHDDAYLKACRDYDFTDEEIIRASTQGSTLPTLYRALQRIRSVPVDFEHFSDNILAHLFEALEQRNLTPDANLIAFLDDIRNQGAEVGIATSAIRKSAARKLAMVELHNEFDVLICADDVDNPKPHPEPFLKLAKALGTEPQYCVIIGDSQTDIIAGKDAGMKAIGFTKYLKNKQALSGADLIVDSFTELNYDRIRQLLKH